MRQSSGITKAQIRDQAVKTVVVTRRGGAKLFTNGLPPDKLGLGLSGDCASSHAYEESKINLLRLLLGFGKP
jgi:hypothetical protein